MISVLKAYCCHAQRTTLQKVPNESVMVWKNREAAESNIHFVLEVVDPWLVHVTRMGYSRKYPHDPPWTTLEILIRNAQWIWLEIHKFLQNFVNFYRNSRKTIQIFAKFWNSSRFWISRFWNPAKLQVSFLGILKFLGTQFSVVHGGGGAVDIFWNSLMPPWKLTSFLPLLWRRFHKLDYSRAAVNECY